MSEKYEHIAIDLIDEDVKNHRLVTDTKSDDELEKSILEKGVQTPVKLNAKGDGRYTLVWGFRRKAMALKAGLTTLPSLVVEGLSTTEIRTLQAIENLERKELHPLEEAEFCAELLETLTADHEQSDISADIDISEAIAQRIGRSIKWVDDRLAMARLSERVKQTFIDGDIHLRHAQLIARLASHDDQEEVLGMVKASIPLWLSRGADKNDPRHAESKDPPATVAHTRSLVEERLRDLSNVPWLLESEFDGKVACSACPHNSANRLELFHDDAPKNPQCLMASCYAEKSKFTSRAVQRATNTALKTADKPTKTQVEEAIFQREVSFVKPEAVTQSVKTRKQPTKTSTSENKGEDKRRKEAEIIRTLRERLYEWEAEATKALEQALPTKDTVCAAILMLIYNCSINSDAQSDDEKTSAAAQKKLKTAIDQIKKDSGEPATRLHKAANALKPYLTEVGRHGYLQELRWYGDEEDSVALQMMINALGVKLDIEMPTREAIEAELAQAQKNSEGDQS